jgi:pimeloyl-ACP methyl ester carboxylesterase
MQYRSTDLGGPIGYADFGGDGPPLVLIHGLAGAHVNWMAVAPKLAESYRVLAPDLVGFGRTPLAGRESTVETNLDVVTRFVEEAAGAPALVVGHSMGGLLTLMLAASRPDLVAAAVAVSSASPPGDACHPMPAEEEALLTMLLDDLEGGAQLAQAHAASLGPQELVSRAFAYMCARPVDPLILEAHVALEAERGKVTDSFLAYLQAFKSLRGLGDDFETFDALIREITAPLLIVHGLQDPVVPADNMLRVARLRADWDAAWLDGVGHNVQMEAPDEFLAGVEPFLAKNAAAVTA